MPQGASVCEPHQMYDPTLKPQVAVQTVVRRMRGGAQSSLVRCDNGKLYVLKMTTNPQGPNVLANEFLGGYLLAGLGIACPATQALLVTDQTISGHQSLCFETMTHKRTPPSGLHLGSEFLETEGCRLYDWMPASRFKRITNADDFVGIYVFDVWASHQDQRQCIYRQDDEDGAVHASFIDNGHLFGGPDWTSFDTPSRSLMIFPTEQRLRMETLTDWWVSHIRNNGDRLVTEGIAHMPSEWYSGDLSAMISNLRHRLGTLHKDIQKHCERTSLGNCKTDRADDDVPFLRSCRPVCN